MNNPFGERDRVQLIEAIVFAAGGPVGEDAGLYYFAMSGKPAVVAVKQRLCRLVQSGAITLQGRPVAATGGYPGLLTDIPAEYLREPVAFGVDESAWPSEGRRDVWCRLGWNGNVGLPPRGWNTEYTHVQISAADAAKLASAAPIAAAGQLPPDIDGFDAAVTAAMKDKGERLSVWEVRTIAKAKRLQHKGAKQRADKIGDNLGYGALSRGKKPTKSAAA